MEEAQKEERKENRGDGRFIQRVYMWSSSDIPKLYAICRYRNKFKEV